MKLFPVIGLSILVSACTNYEDQVKDLRNHDIVIDDDFSEEDSTPEVIEDTVESTNAVVSPAKSEWTYKVTSISDNNWGYQIYQKGTMLINQTTIPSVQGIDGFDTKEKAERTAQHILSIVENGTFPPTVNKEELEKLGVLRD